MIFHSCFFVFVTSNVTSDLLIKEVAKQRKENKTIMYVCASLYHNISDKKAYNLS